MGVWCLYAVVGFSKKMGVDIVPLLLDKELSLHLLLADNRLNELTEPHLGISSASRKCILVLLYRCYSNHHSAQQRRNRDSVPLALHHSATHGRGESKRCFRLPKKFVDGSECRNTSRYLGLDILGR